MKRLFNILVFFSLALIAAAQEDTRTIDSLQSALRDQKGREKVETMIMLSRAFFDYSFDDCIDWGEKAIDEAMKMQDVELAATAYGEMGLHYLNHYEFDLSKENFEKALEILGDEGDPVLVLDVLNYLGRVELFMGDMDLALSTYQRDLEISERLGKEMNCADVTNNLAYIFFYQDDFDKAMGLFQDARQRYVRLEDTLSVAQCDNNISNIYVMRQQYDKARAVLQQAIPVFEQYEDEESLAHAYQNLGTVYATGHINLDSALVYLRKSIECAENVGDEITLVEDEIELANVLKLLGRDKEALSLYQAALQTSEAMNHVNGVLEAYKQLGIHYYEVHDFATSMGYLRRCLDLANEKGNRLCANTVRPYLIADLARLGRFDEMNKEMGILQDEYASSVAENADLDKGFAALQDEAQWLFSKYETQNSKIETLQTQRNHYRLAFFGLLAIALFALMVMVSYKIVRKKRK